MEDFVKKRLIGIGPIAAIAAICALGLVVASGTGALARDKGKAGGKSVSNISEKGSENTNSPASGDQDTGLERAQERRSEQGLEHGKAPDEGDEDGSSEGKGKGKGKNKGGKDDGDEE